MSIILGFSTLSPQWAPRDRSQIAQWVSRFLAVAGAGGVVLNGIFLFRIYLDSISAPAVLLCVFSILPVLWDPYVAAPEYGNKVWLGMFDFFSDLPYRPSTSD